MNNFFNRFFLKLILLPSGLYRKMGVHIPHLKAILVTKLMMDDRRPNSIQQSNRAKKDTPAKFATLGTMFLSALMGCIFLIAFSIGSDYLTKLTVYFAFYIFMLASTLVADFTSVLIDVRDNMIILPKPVNDKTFVLARLLHIIIHVSKLVLPMTMPAMILISIKHGVAGLLPFIFMILAATLFTIFLINALYILILKITTPEKFKRIIGNFQIFFAIFIYAAYQLVPRLIDEVAMSGYSARYAAWVKLFPPYWFAAGWDYIRYGPVNSPMVIYFVLSIILPVLSLWVVIKYFAPSFNRKLSMIGGSDSSSTSPKKNGQPVISTTSGYIRMMSHLLTKKGSERMAFLHAWKITSRSREFKMKVYPSIGYLVVYVFVIFFRNSKTSLADLHDPSGKGKFFFIGMIYFSSFILMLAIQRIMYTDKYKAAWIYYITPIQTPGYLVSGATKAAILKFYVPIVVVISIVSIMLVGPVMIPNLILGFCNQLLITLLIAYLQVRALPFSIQEDTKIKGGNFLKGLFSLAFPFMFGIIQFLVYNMQPVVIILAVLACIASWLMMDALKNKNWNKLQLKEYEG
jgi:ABC-2 type transport system permease protein